MTNRETAAGVGQDREIGVSNDTFDIGGLSDRHSVRPRTGLA